MMSLRSLQRQWTILGQRDPYWAILTNPGKKNNQWDIEEFFATGVVEIERAIQYVETMLPLKSRKRALDFGCGAGRLSQALASHFEQVNGVDISPPMIELARKHNCYRDRVEYVLNERRDLAVFPDRSFDFIYSNITLQHMRQRLIRAYLRELVRVLAPGGALLFQLPTHAREKWKSCKERIMQFLYGHYWWHFRKEHPFQEMHSLNREKVVVLIERAGGCVLDMTSNGNAGPDWYSLSYLVTKT